jgi:hypothetical protein
VEYYQRSDKVPYLNKRLMTSKNRLIADGTGAVYSEKENAPCQKQGAFENGETSRTLFNELDNISQRSIAQQRTELRQDVSTA